METFGVGPNVAAMENGPWVLYAQRTNTGGYALTLELRSADPSRPGRMVQDIVTGPDDAAPSIKKLHDQFDGVPVDLGSATAELRQRTEAAKGDKAELNAAMADFQAKSTGKPLFPFKDAEIMGVLDHLFGGAA